MLQFFKLSSAVGVQRKMTFLLLGEGRRTQKKGFSSTLKFKFSNPSSDMNIKMKQPNAIKLTKKQNKAKKEVLKDEF